MFDKELIEYLVTKNLFFLVPPATKEEISEFESKNGIALPNGYREWLLYSDGGEFLVDVSGVQLFGVSHKPFIDPEDPDRPDSRYTVIGKISNGDPILCEQGTERVSIYNREADSIAPSEDFDDFKSFIDGMDEFSAIRYYAEQFKK